MKLFLKFGLTLLLSIVLTFYITGCVETDNPAISTLDQRSTVKFVNLSNLSTSMNVNVDGNSVTAVNYGDASGYLDIAAGTRTFIFAYGSKIDTMRKALDPNAKFSVFSVYEPLNGDVARTYYFYMERHTYSGTVAYVPQTVLVRFLNLTNDTMAAKVNFTLSDTITVGTTHHDTSMSAITPGTGTPYYQKDLSLGPLYLITSQYGGTIIIPTSISPEGRYSIVLYGNKTAGSLQTKVIKED